MVLLLHKNKEKRKIMEIVVSTYYKYYIRLFETGYFNEILELALLYLATGSQAQE